MQKGGGYIKNNRTGKRRHVIERQGVYVINMTVPELNAGDLDTDSSFVGRG